MKVKLHKIIGIESKRTCFCGKPLIANLCEEHGSDIKISTNVIHVQFELKNENETQKLINANLTENQLITIMNEKNLFSKVDFKENYSIISNSFGSTRSLDDIVEEFLNQLEFDYFYGKKRIKEVQITNSGITINFLFDFVRHDGNSNEVTFEIVLMRKLSDYIAWRFNHCKTTKENITKSLISTRKNITLESGVRAFIQKVFWNREFEDFTKIGVLISDQNGCSIEIPANEIYQIQNDFYLNPRMEVRILSALHSFVQNFLRSFQQFMRLNGILAEVTKSKREDKTSLLEKILGKNIAISFDEFEQIIAYNK